MTQHLIRLAPHEGNEAPLRLVRRPGAPDVDVPDDVLEWFWFRPIVSEGLAPTPARRFDHVAAVMATPLPGDRREAWSN